LVRNGAQALHKALLVPVIVPKEVMRDHKRIGAFAQLGANN